MSMNHNVPEKIVALNRINIQAAISIANIGLDSAERLCNVQLNAAKVALADGAQNFSALSQVKDMQGLLALIQFLPQGGVEKAVEHSRSVYEIAAQAQSEIGQIVEGRINEFNKEVVAALELAAKSAPAGIGADAAVAAVKSAVAAANSAYDTMTKAAKQATDLAEANVTAVTHKAVGGAKKKTAA